MYFIFYFFLFTSENITTRAANQKMKKIYRSLLRIGGEKSVENCGLVLEF